MLLRFKRGGAQSPFLNSMKSDCSASLYHRMSIIYETWGVGLQFCDTLKDAFSPIEINLCLKIWVVIFST